MNNNTPFFSILLPTKNRPNRWPIALRSVLDQTFKDYELLFIDNDDNGLTAKKWIDYLPLLDSRHRYIRTGGKNMPDNWEYGRQHITGKYFFVLEDKAILYPNSLHRLYEIVEKHGQDYLVFKHNLHRMESFDFDHSIVLPQIKYPQNLAQNSETIVKKTKKVLSTFVNEGWKGLYREDSPRIINTLVKVDFTKKIEVEGRFFHSISPDVCAGLLLLDSSENYEICQNPIISFDSSPNLSNGSMTVESLEFAANARDAWGAMANAHLWHLPCAGIPSLHVGLAADYLKIQSLAANKLHGIRLSVEKYFEFLRADIECFRASGTDYSGLLKYLSRIEAENKNQYFL